MFSFRPNKENMVFRKIPLISFFEKPHFRPISSSISAQKSKTKIPKKKKKTFRSFLRLNKKT